MTEEFSGGYSKARWKVNGHLENLETVGKAQWITEVTRDQKG